jgi:hypothetical protein
MSTEPRNIREVFREHQEDDFAWFCYNPNICEIADEIKELLAAHDTLEQKLAVAVEALEFYENAINYASSSMEITKVCDKTNTITLVEKFEQGDTYNYGTPIILDSGNRATQALSIINSNKEVI